MRRKAVWTEWVTSFVMAVFIVSVTGYVAEAAPPACPCWDIEAVRHAAPAHSFPCQAKSEIEVTPGGPTISSAATRSLNNGQDFHLDAHLFKVKSDHQAWCTCFSNPPIPGCVSAKVTGLAQPEGQACINDLTRFCKDLGKQ